MVGSGAHEFIRSPMQWNAGPGAGFTTGAPWQALNANYPQFNVASEAGDPQSLLNCYRQLVRARNGSTALRRGTLTTLATSASPVLAFTRRDSLQTVLCLANTAAASLAGVSLTVPAAALAPGQYAARDLIDPSVTRTVIVTGGGQVSGLDLAAYEVRAFELLGASAVEPGRDTLPRTGLRLGPALPNPFNPATTIRYALPGSAHLRIGVYDLAGRELAVLADGMRAAGPGEVRWDGTDARGQALGAGVYFVRADAGGEAQMTKLTLVK